MSAFWGTPWLHSSLPMPWRTNHSARLETKSLCAKKIIVCCMEWINQCDLKVYGLSHKVSTLVGGRQYNGKSKKQQQKPFLFSIYCKLSDQWYLWKATCSRLTLWGSGCERTGEPLCTGGVAPARIHWIGGGSSMGLATSPASISKYLAPRRYSGNW